MEVGVQVALVFRHAREEVCECHHLWVLRYRFQHDSSPLFCVVPIVALVQDEREQKAELIHRGRTTMFMPRKGFPFGLRK